MNTEGMETLYEGEAVYQDMEVKLQYAGILLEIQSKPVMSP